MSLDLSLMDLADISAGDFLVFAKSPGNPLVGTLTPIEQAAALIAVTQEKAIAVSDETTPLTGASTTVPKASFHLSAGFNITGVKIGLSTAPTGAALITVDVRINGVSILSTLLTIDAGELTSGTAATPAVLTANPVVGLENDIIQVYLTQIDTGNTATGLKFYMIGNAT